MATRKDFAETFMLLVRHKGEDADEVRKASADFNDFCGVARRGREMV